MKQIKGLVLIGMMLACCMAARSFARDSKPADVPPRGPTPGRVTLLDLGANKCVPCKMMAPIIEELKKEYEGRASIIFIDVWENPDEGSHYGIQSIPTQIFYDKDGKEAVRHVGFLDKKSIVSILEDLGVPRDLKP
jgi:thioredoxin 1